MTESTWSQPITQIEPNKVAVRGYRIDELMGRVPFAHVVYLVLKGELPLTGCHLPTHPSIYEPILGGLQAQGLSFKEKTEPLQIS